MCCDCPDQSNGYNMLITVTKLGTANFASLRSASFLGRKKRQAALPGGPRKLMGSTPSNFSDTSCARVHGACADCATPGAEKLARKLQEKIRRKAEKLQRERRKEERAAQRREEMAQGRLRL